MICLEDGSVRFGDEAPRAKDVNQFLREHPGYTIARPDLSEEEVITWSHRRARVACIRLVRDDSPC